MNRAKLYLSYVRRGTDGAARGEAEFTQTIPSRDRGRQKSTDGAARGEAEFIQTIPKYRANESRVKLAWLCRVQPIFNES